MPPASLPGQPDESDSWFGTEAGWALLQSEQPAVVHALGERPGQPWVWLAPVAQDVGVEGRGLCLSPWQGDWIGSVHCALPLPLASESTGVVVLQHVLRPGADGHALLQECARVLVPGGLLWLFALNPLAPYRWRWRGEGLRASEPLAWRRRLRSVGLAPEAVSQGVGPGWQVRVSQSLQSGPGLRAAYAIRAEKRTLPLTPLRQRAPLRLAQGIPAA